MRAAPIILVALGEPWRDDQHRAFLKILVAHGHRARHFAREEGDGGIEAQRFAEDVADVAHVLEHRGGEWGIASQRHHFGTRGVLDMRAFRQHVERPGHGAGRCFMAREEDGGYLIHHLLQGEGIAGFGMLRFDQRLEDILVR